MKPGQAESAKILEDFEKDYEIGGDIWDPIHAAWDTDIDFMLNGKQWDAQERQNRLNSTPPRPTLVFNKSLPHGLKITNDVKKMKPGVKVRGVGEEDKELAEVRQGMQRGIERESNGQAVYNNTLLLTVAGGVGFWRIKNEFMNEMSFEQVLRLEGIQDSTNVRTSQWTEPDASDIEFAIITEPISKKKFKETTGKDPDEYQGLDTHKSWGNENELFIHEYWYLKREKETLCEVVPGIIPEAPEPGETAYLSDLKKYAKRDGLEVDDLIETYEDGEQITRPTTKPIVYWCKVVGKEVLSKKKWEGKWIPLVICKGRMVKVKGKTKLHSLTHSLKDAQSSYNYARSAQIERMSLTPKTPFTYAMGSIPKNEKHKYETSNTRNWWGLGYNAYDEKGRLNPPPERMQPIGADPAMAQEVMLASEDIKSVSGQHDPSLGKGEGSKSGIALRELKESGDTSTYDYPYELGLSIRHSARIIDDLIPFTYSTERQITIIGDDDSEKIVWVNKQVEADEQNKPGYHYDLNKGNFNIEVEMGLSQSTKRQETLEGLEGLFRSNPAFSEILGDLYVMEQDWRFSDVAAKRIRKHLEKQYPGIVEPDDDEEKEGPPPEVLEMQQALQELEQAFEAVQKENEDLKTDKSIEAQKVENEDIAKGEKNEIDFMNAETKRIEADDKADTETKRLILEAEKIDIEKDKLELERQKMANDAQRELNQAEASRNDAMNGERDEANRKVIEDKFQGVIDGLTKKLEEVQNRKIEPAPLPNISVNVEASKGTGKSSIKPDGKGGYEGVNSSGEKFKAVPDGKGGFGIDKG